MNFVQRAPAAGRRRRAVITGVGPIAPNGIGAERFWEGAVRGRSSVRRIDGFDPAPFETQIASAVRDFDPLRFGLGSDEARRLDRYVQFAIAAAKLAIEDAALALSDTDLDRVGVCIGNAISGTRVMEREFVAVTERGRRPIDPARVAPDLYHASMFNTPSNEISARYGTHGPCVSVPTGCTSGLDCIGYAVQAIADDDADVMIAGAAEAPITPVVLAAFDVINCLSRRNDEPERASRPFDRDRSGFVLAEGCGIVVLEEMQHARARGARIYAEATGYASGSNAFHMTDLAPDGADMARVIRQSLRDAEIASEAVDHVSAHGSSTVQNDRNETAAITKALGANASRVTVNSLKSIIGHPLSAANALEIIASLLSMRAGVLHPTINYERPDPECALDYVPNVAREARPRTVLKLASGFSGIHSAMVLRAVE